MIVGLTGLLFLGVFEAAGAVDAFVAGERRVTLDGRTLEVTWDAESHAPQTISGIGDDLLEVKNVAALTRREINDIGALLVDKYNALLRVRADQLVLKHAEKTAGSWYVSYRQTARGMPVYGSSLGFSIDADGRIRSLGALLYPDVPAPAALKISRGDALAIARSRLEDPDKAESRVLAESVAIYPERKAGSVDYRVVYIFNFFPGKATHPASVARGAAVFVDTQTGEIVRTQTLLKPLGCCLPKDWVPTGRRGAMHRDPENP